MDINPQEFQRRYAELSDEGLLEINPEELTDIARQYYDDELRARGLHAEEPFAEETPEPNLPLADQLVHIETFLNMHEADMALTLLRSAEIPAQLENESSTFAAGAGGLRLMVPGSYELQAEEILASQISDEELLAQAEAAGGADAGDQNPE